MMDSQMFYDDQNARDPFMGNIDASGLYPLDEFLSMPPPPPPSIEVVQVEDSKKRNRKQTVPIKRNGRKNPKFDLFTEIKKPIQKLEKKPYERKNFVKKEPEGKF